MRSARARARALVQPRETLRCARADPTLLRTRACRRLTGQSKRAQPELYRDEHMDEHLLPLVAQEVAQMQRVQAQA